MVWMTSTKLPQASVSVYVRVIVPRHGSVNGPSTNPIARSTSAVQLSAAVPPAATSSAYVVTPAGTSASHSTITSVGAVASGSVVSLTVMVWMTSTKLPHVSVMVYVRVIVPPHGSVSRPSANPIVRSTPAVQLSDAVPPAATISAYVATPAGTSASHSTTTSVGAVASGSVVSFTVIVWMTSTKLPQASVSVYVRVIVAGHGPDNGPSTNPIVRSAPAVQLSDAVPPAAT